MSFTAAPGGDQYVEQNSPLKKRRVQQPLQTAAAAISEAASSAGGATASDDTQLQHTPRLTPGGDCVAQRTRSKTLTPEELPSTSSAAAARHSSSNTNSYTNSNCQHVIGVTPQRGTAGRAGARSTSGGNNSSGSNLLNYYRKTRKVSHTRGKPTAAPAAPAPQQQPEQENSLGKLPETTNARLQASSSAVIAAAAAIDAARQDSGNNHHHNNNNNNVAVKRLDKKSNSSNKYIKYRKSLRNYQQQVLARIDGTGDKIPSKDDEQLEKNENICDNLEDQQQHLEAEAEANNIDVNEEENTAATAAAIDGGANGLFEAAGGNNSAEELDDQEQDQEEDEDQDQEEEVEAEEEEVGFYEIVNSADSSYEDDAQIVAEEDELSEEEDVDDEEDDDLEEDFDEEEDDLSEGEFAEHIIGELGGELHFPLFTTIHIYHSYTQSWLKIVIYQ